MRWPPKLLRVSCWSRWSAPRSHGGESARATTRKDGHDLLVRLGHVRRRRPDRPGRLHLRLERQLTAAIGALPVMFAGAGIAFAGVARFSAAASGPPLIGQEMAVLLAIVALAAVALGVGLAGRESSR